LHHAINNARDKDSSRETAQVGKAVTPTNTNILAVNAAAAPSIHEGLVTRRLKEQVSAETWASTVHRVWSNMDKKKKSGPPAASNEAWY